MVDLIAKRLQAKIVAGVAIVLVVFLGAPTASRPTSR